MIPKIIHYCWFGEKPLTNDVKRYIKTWKEKCPDYQIMQWNESNFDVKINQYVKEAYMEKKWAFVSDYVRLYALKMYGGIYLDTDVEVLKSFDEFLENKSFIGAESKFSVCTAVIGAEKGASFIEELLDLYRDLRFLADGKIDDMPNSHRIYYFLQHKYNYNTTNIIYRINHCNVYPSEYFSPINCFTYRKELTSNTVCIHWFAGTWKSKDERIRNRLKALITRVIGEEIRNNLKIFLHRGKDK